MGLICGYCVAALMIVTDAKWMWAFGLKIFLLYGLTLLIHYKLTFVDVDVRAKGRPPPDTDEQVELSVYE